MSTASQLKQAALQEANRIFEKAAKLKPELKKLEERKAFICSALHEASLVHERARNFVPTLGSDVQCPSCWVMNEARSTLTPVRGTDTEDIFSCNVCGYDWHLPLE